MFEHLTVIELSQILAGPLCGMFFAELGARVIKVESPRGDPTRQWFSAHEDSDASTSAYFSCCNWGKESIALDLHNPDDKELLNSMVRSADIITNSQRPGKALQTATDYESFAAINDRIIYLEISGYGPHDPRPGFDAIIQAESGFTYLNGEVDGTPVKMPVALIDVLLAHQAKEALLLALLKREWQGIGSHLSLSLIDVAVSSLANQASNYLMSNHIPQRIGSQHPNIMPYGTIYYSKDNLPLVLGIGTETQFEKLCAMLEREHLLQDERFITNKKRVQHRNVLQPLLEQAIKQRTRESLIQEASQIGIPIGAVKNLKEVFQDSNIQSQLLSDGICKSVRTCVFSGIDTKRAIVAPPTHNMHGIELRKEFNEYD